MSEGTSDGSELEDEESSQVNENRLIYDIEDVPPWYMNIFIGFQNIVSMFGISIITPLLIADLLCIPNDIAAKGDLVCTMLFVCGIATFLQATCGIRLPMIEGPSMEYIVVLMTWLNNENAVCLGKSSESQTIIPVNTTSVNIPESLLNSIENNTNTTFFQVTLEVEPSWQTNIRKLQGAVIVSGLIEMVIGLSGLVGVLRRFISPLVMTTCIVLMGISITLPALKFASKQWAVAGFTMLVVIILSQYLFHIYVPCCSYKKHEGCIRSPFPIFKLFSVITAIVLGWILCTTFTLTNVFSPRNDSFGYYARTDIRKGIIEKSSWFRFPYPGQWGVPIFDVSTLVAVFPAIIFSIIDSIEEYYGCARVCGVPFPPIHAMNRGIAVEGVGCFLAGAWGFGSGISTIGGNIGLIPITRVASRRSIQYAALLMIGLGVLGKFGALFVTIPDPVIGGSVCVAFSMFTGIGFANLEKVNVTSRRNIFVVGYSVFMGFLIPYYVRENKHEINTGSKVGDDILLGFLTTSMFIGGLIAFILDNTIQGSKEDRGLVEDFPVIAADNRHDPRVYNHLRCYDIPFAKPLFASNWCRYFPPSPTFLMKPSIKRSPSRTSLSSRSKSPNGVPDYQDGETVV